MLFQGARMSIIDDYWDNFYQQNQSDNLHAQTGSDNNTGTQNTGQNRTGMIKPVQKQTRTRMIGFHDPVTADNSITMKYLERMGLADESDNVHAQQDTSGQFYGQKLTDAVNRGAGRVGKQIAYGMKLNADEHLSRAENPLLDITKKGIEVYGKSEAEHQDESAALMLKSALEIMNHKAILGTLDQPIETTVNGKDKPGLVTGGFKNEFITKPQAAFWSAGTMAGDAFKTVVPKEHMDGKVFDDAEEKRDQLQRKADAYEDQSMQLQNIWDSKNPERTVNNLSQYFYESLGSRAPYAALGALRPLMAGTPLASRLLGTSLYGTAQNHSRIRQNTGESNYPKAMLGGVTNAVAGELPFLNLKYNPEGHRLWSNIISNLFSNAIRYGTDQWMKKQHPEDKKGNID